MSLAAVMRLYWHSRCPVDEAFKQVQQLWIAPVVSERKEHRLNMAGFKNLEDLVGDLEAGLQKLRAGKLEPEELTPLVDDARELCDRLVLLRFKAHEFAYEVRRKGPQGGADEQAIERQPVRPFRIGAAYQTSLIDAIEEVSREQAEQAADARRLAGTPDLFDFAAEPRAGAAVSPEPVVDAEEVSEVALGAEEVSEVALGAEEVSEVALGAEEVSEVAEEDWSEVEDDFSIVPDEEAPDSVVEQKEVLEPVAVAEDVPSAKHEGKSTPPEDNAPSLAEHMEMKAIGDLRKAFSLVEKYECIKGLFQDDAVLFDRVLDALDNAGDYQLALLWLKQHVPGFDTWDQEDPTVLRFLERVQRRYAPC